MHIILELRKKVCKSLFESIQLVYVNKCELIQTGTQTSK